MLKSRCLTQGQGEARTDARFSICTLVTDVGEYARCLDSFHKCGFDEHNSEFLWIDNSEHNRFDGYSGIAEFLRQASARYVVICHQDVMLIADGFAALTARLAELDRLDPAWAVAGNSGLRGLTRMAMRISDPLVDDAHIGSLPMRVDSLDENFLIVDRSALVAPSADLVGFHFYGLDLCLQAQRRGRTAYVVDFHLRHNSAGRRSQSYFDGRALLERKYAASPAGRIVRTTCDFCFLGWWFPLRFLRWPLSKAIRQLGKLGLIGAI